jgi:DNA phosphorothioation-associated putative methyltransferase
MSAAHAVGKRVRGALYVHHSALADLPAPERALIERASRLTEDFHWSVARLDLVGTVGLLDYPEFDSDAFPALARAALVDVSAPSVRFTDYHNSANPLILHRKELLVSAGHPQRLAWAALTTELEQLGLFRDWSRIGRRDVWRAMLTDAGRDTQGQKLE